MNVLVALLLVVFMSSAAFAEEQLYYHDVPYWYTDAMPDKIECQPTTQVNLRDCRVMDVPNRVPVVVSYRDGSQRRVIDMTTYITVNCYLQVCRDSEGTVAGSARSPEGVAANAGVNWFTMRGYYIGEENGRFYAFRHGTGPDADNYGRPFILNDNVQPTTGGEQHVFNVWCAPDSDVCDFEGNSVPRQDLKNTMPVVETEHCDMLFCYNNDDYVSVVGRAPYGMLGE